MSRHLSRAALVLAIAAAPCLADAQVVSPVERDALVRLMTRRGGTAAELDALLRRVEDAAASGLPAAPLVNKVREGLAKGSDPRRIQLVIEQMASSLATADRLLGALDLPADARHADAVTLLADALDSGATPAEVEDLRRQAEAAGRLSSEALAGASKGLSLIKDARLSASDGAAVMAEALRRSYAPAALLDLGREVKRHERDFRAGRATLRALRDAIARGDRPEQLFTQQRIETVERPATARPEAPVVERPERPVRPETPVRPERPERPQRPAVR